MKKIKTGDEVIVIAGKDKGKQGTVSSILSDGRCYVTGVKMVKRHTKPNPQAGIQGGIVEKEMSIHLSNLMLLEKSKAVKVGFKILENGKKVRVNRKNNNIIK